MHVFIDLTNYDHAVTADHDQVPHVAEADALRPVVTRTDALITAAMQGGKDFSEAFCHVAGFAGAGLTVAKPVDAPILLNALYLSAARGLDKHKGLSAKGRNDVATSLRGLCDMSGLPGEDELFQAIASRAEAIRQSARGKVFKQQPGHEHA